jgi:predicted GNAT superfamily acetyltransferase
MIVMRECRGLEELEACVQLQIDVWGYADGDVIPRRVFLVAQKIGGQVIGAFDIAQPDAAEQGGAANMIGFALSLPGVKSVGPDGKVTSYLHSHMLALREGYRNAGIGRRLKLAQREDALRRGITHMEWTFDPLEIKNAYLNLHRLGAIVRRYEPNFYGNSSSRLQGGLPTDRLVAEWPMASQRVVQRLAEDCSDRRQSAKSSPVNAVMVPAAIYAWKADENTRSKAEEVQTQNRKQLQEAFQHGLAAVDYYVDEDGSGHFVLGSWPVANEALVAG